MPKTIRKATIYLATNSITGKSYVGYDSAWPRRKQVHIRNAFKPNSRQYHGIFHRSIRKYGPEAFFWKVIYSSEDFKNTLHVMESKFIQEHNSHYLYGNGYNMTLGGEGVLGFKHPPRTEKTKQKLSILNRGNQYAKGQVHTEEQNKAHSEFMRGRKHTEEWKQALSLRLSGVLTGPQPKILCPHCQKLGGARLMKRYHFENCKEKK